MRSALKKPVGELVRDDLVSKQLLLEKVFGRKALVVSIGDRTTERLEEFGLSPNLEIVDSVERRSPRLIPPWKGSSVFVFRASNPAGGISGDSLSALKMCADIISKDSDLKLRLVIAGEEDLLTLPVLAFFPGRVIALYGQPGEGMVIADSDRSRNTCQSYLKEIGITSL